MNQRDKFVMWNKRPKYAAKFAKKKKSSSTPSEGADAAMKDGEEELKANDCDED